VQRRGGSTVAAGKNDEQWENSNAIGHAAPLPAWPAMTGLAPADIEWGSK
jgi:hypothetical protein